jgi:enoyl-CoA hydratase/carnithine racemase
MNTQGQILLKVAHGHAAITISNPARRNAVSLDMWQQITELVGQADKDASVRLITLRGTSGTFVSGADISEFETTRSTAEKAAHYEAQNRAAFAALRDARTPTLALVEGFCFGGGVGLAAACDLRFAASNAKVCIPAAKLGLAYPVAGVRDVVQLIGPARTKRLFFSAETIDAKTALDYGFFEEVVEVAAFAQRAQALIDSILSRAPLTQQAAKSAVAAVYHPAMLTQAAKDAQGCFASQDYAEGRAAFLEKRKPVFHGS